MADTHGLGRFGGDLEEADLDALDDPPVPFTLVGWLRKATVDDTGEVIIGDDGRPVHEVKEYEFHVVAKQGFGPVMYTMLQTNVHGRISPAAGVKFIANAIVGEERELFEETISDPEVYFAVDAILGIAKELAELYADRPTSSRSERRAGLRATGKTSVGGRSVAALGR